MLLLINRYKFAPDTNIEAPDLYYAVTLKLCRNFLVRIDKKAVRVNAAVGCDRIGHFLITHL